MFLCLVPICILKPVFSKLPDFFLSSLTLRFGFKFNLSNKIPLIYSHRSVLQAVYVQRDKRNRAIIFTCSFRAISQLSGDIFMKQKTSSTQETIRETIIASDGFTYKYTLSAGKNRDSLYSLKIVMTSSDGDMRSSTASVAMSDGGRAIAFYNKLVSNLATPSNLQYCIEDEFY